MPTLTLKRAFLRLRPETRRLKRRDNLFDVAVKLSACTAAPPRVVATNRGERSAATLWWNRTDRFIADLIARGRDAADVPLTHIFGPGTLSSFRVWAEEAPPGSAFAARS
jgi:hypothetical protein